MRTRQLIDLENTRRERRWLEKNHPLRQLFWECTLRCNFSCLHCGSDCRKETQGSEMPLEQFLPVLDEIKAHQPKVKTLVHTVGGEPLMRKDIVECGRAITQKGFYWGLVTNGYLLDARMMQALSEAGLRTIAVDVDGLREDHNWLRDNPRSFDKVFDAIGHIQKVPNLTWDVITCVNRRNIHTLEAVKRMLVEAGVRKWRCFTIFPAGRAKDRDDMLLTDDEFLELMDFIAETREKGDIQLSYSCEGFLGDYEGRVRRTHFLCLAGLTVASVLSDGGISGCLSIRSDYRQGNIFEDGFWPVWNDRFQRYRERSWMKTGPCTQCDMFKYCEGNGMHLRDENGALMLCHYNRINGIE